MTLGVFNYEHSMDTDPFTTVTSINALILDRGTVVEVPRGEKKVHGE